MTNPTDYAGKSEAPSPSPSLACAPKPPPLLLIDRNDAPANQPDWKARIRVLRTRPTLIELNDVPGNYDSSFLLIEYRLREREREADKSGKGGAKVIRLFVIGSKFALRATCSRYVDDIR